MKIKDLYSIYGLQTPRAWDLRVSQRLAEYGMSMPRIWPDAVTAYVSDGRWVADCPYDNGGIGVAPDNPSGFDMGCGTMVAVIFPDGWQEAVQVLEARPRPSDAHWFPQRGESIVELRRENAKHGFAVGRP